MAASNAPKHDFAPPWLKIPSPNENTRPTGSRSSHTQDRSRQRHDEYYNHYSSRDYPRPLHRQNSFDTYDGSRRYSPSHANKFRQHSVEDDYYMGYYGYNPYPLAYDEHYSMQFRSQPSLPRQDMKHPPAPSRYGQVSGSYNGFGPFYDFFPPGEGFSSYGSGGHNTKRSHYARDGRTDSKESRDSDRSYHEDDKDKNFNSDFPSLNGTDEDGDVKTSKNSCSGGVWNNPPRSKSEEATDLKNSSSVLYKVVPVKNGSARKGSSDGIHVNGTVRDVSPLASVKSGSSRENQQQSPTQPVETLGTRLVHPKPADKKSEFLKALRNVAGETDNDNSQHNGVGDSNEHGSSSNLQNDAQMVMNGVVELQLNKDYSRPYKFSSVEDELKFMRFLGWDESDQPPEITEDEKREFWKNLIHRQQIGRQLNGQSRLLTKWIPQSLASSCPQQHVEDLDKSRSSSESESDTDDRFG